MSTDCHYIVSREHPDRKETHATLAAALQVFDQFVEQCKGNTEADGAQRVVQLQQVRTIKQVGFNQYVKLSEL